MKFRIPISYPYIISNNHTIGIHVCITISRKNIKLKHHKLIQNDLWHYSKHWLKTKSVIVPYLLEITIERCYKKKRKKCYNKKRKLQLNAVSKKKKEITIERGNIGVKCIIWGKSGKYLSCFPTELITLLVTCLVEKANQIKLFKSNLYGLDVIF